jgi:hypothetical protein
MRPPFFHKSRIKTFFKALILIFLIGAIYKFFMLPNSNLGYSPEQPIVSNHQIHVEKNRISCTFCHSTVEKTDAASLPSLDICMDCHKQVARNLIEIKKIRNAFLMKKYIQWTRVYDLPDHVRFSHKRHIASGINCISCHGEIFSMVKIEKTNRQNMGTCLDCHRQPNIFLKPENPYDKIKAQKKGINPASVSCNICHF